MRTVPLGGKVAKGRVALVDDDDYNLVAPYRWRAGEYIRPNGSLCGPYVITNAKRPDGRRYTLSMHVLVAGYTTGVDHINHDGLDNRRENLRPAGKRDNNRNRRKTVAGQSQYKGVSRAYKTRWNARIRVDGRSVFLGYFRSEMAAARAYDAAAREYFGEFAYTNFAD